MISGIYCLFPEQLGSFPLLDKRYRLLMTLGEGRHAKVKLAKDEKSNSYVAVKLLRKQFKELELSLLHNEVRALIRLGDAESPPTQTMIDFNFYGEIRFPNNTVRKTAYFAMKVEEHGELYGLIERTNGFSENIARVLFRDLVESIEFLHERNIVHRDIKTENILLTKDFKLKLCDLGSCSNIIKYDNDSIITPTEAVGSPEYNPPEVHLGISEKTPSALKSADIFAIGCALFLMVVNSFPFKIALPEDPYYSRLISNNTQSYWKCFIKANPVISAEFKDLFERMTCRYPEDRISLFEIKKHAWFNGPTETKDVFNKELYSRVQIVGEAFQVRAFKYLERVHKSESPANSKLSHTPLADHLKKYMLDLKHKTRRSKNDVKSPNHHSSKSSSNGESIGESEDPPPPPSIGKFQGKSVSTQHKPPTSMRRGDSWASLSDNDDNSN